jgi:hypothetical protein
MNKGYKLTITKSSGSTFEYFLSPEELEVIISEAIYLERTYNNLGLHELNIIEWMNIQMAPIRDNTKYFIEDMYE